MNQTRSLVVWIFEMLGEAIGTGVAFLILAIGSDPIRHAETFAAYGTDLAEVTVVAIIGFGLSGYILVALLAAHWGKHQRWSQYPVISGVLYLGHATLLLYAFGNRFDDWPKGLLFLQVSGSCIAFTVTLMGDRLRRSRWGTRHVS